MTGMDGKVLANEMLAAIGGKVDKRRRKAFEKMCDTIVKHIQVHAIVTGTSTTGGPVTGKVL